jgi:hypothetical protein
MSRTRFVALRRYHTHPSTHHVVANGCAFPVWVVIQLSVVCFADGLLWRRALLLC